MNLVRIYLKNFSVFYYKLGITELEIDRSNSINRIVLILGQNGSGKSSLLSEITPLPLEHTNNRTKSRILPDKEGIKELDYVVNDEIFYRIHIEYGKKTNCYISKRFLYENELTELNPTGNVSTYMEILERELGFTKNFTKVGYLTNTLTNFVNMKPAERNDFISDWLPNLTLFLHGYKVCQKHYNQKKKEVENLNRELGKLGDLDFELKINEIKASMNYIKDSIDKINENITRCKVKTHEWSDYTWQFNHINLLKHQVLENFRILNDRRTKLMHSTYEISKYMGKKGKELLIKDINNAQNNAKNIESYIKNIDIDLQRLHNDINEKMLNVDNLIYEKSFDEVIECIKNQEKEYYDLKKIEKSIENDNKRALNIFENMKKSDIYEFFNIMDYILLSYEHLEHDNSTSFEDLQLSIEKDTLLIEKTKEENNNTKQEIENLKVEKRRLDDSEDLKELLSKAPKGCSASSCEIMKYLTRFLDVNKEKAIIDQKIEYLDKIDSNQEALISTLTDKITHSTAILETLVKIGDFLYQKRAIFVNFSPFLKDLLSISDTLFIIVKINEIKSLIPGFKEYLTFKERMNELNNSINELKNIKSNMIIQNNLDKEMAEYNALLDKKDNYIKDMDFYNDLVDNLSNIENNKALLDEKIELFNKDVIEVKNQRTKLITIIEGAKNYDLLNKYISNVEKEKALKIKEYEDLEREKDIMHTNYANKQQIEKLRDICLKEMKKYETLMRIWSPKVGYPAWEIEDFLYRLKEETNNDLNALWFSNLTVEDFEIGQNMFSIIVRSNEVLIPDASELSESERATLALAISFAIIEMNLVNKKYNVVRLDEQDGMLDSIRRKAFLATIENMINRMNCQTCFIVTHNNEFENIPTDVILLTNLNNEMYSNLLKNKNILFHL